MDGEFIHKEVSRRLGIIKDQLIGQSPEDLERHYRLIGQQDALKGILDFIETNNKPTGHVPEATFTKHI